MYRTTQKKTDIIIPIREKNKLNISCAYYFYLSKGEKVNHVAIRQATK